jgi:hypothetical protein
MKKRYFISLFFLFFIFSGKGQNTIYRQMFDSLKNITYDQYMTPSANDQNYYGDGMSYTMEALIRMYEQTNELTYIEDFINNSHEIIKNRDDYREIGRKLPVWSTKFRNNNCYGPMTHQTALILIPMIHYCYLSSFDKKEIFSTLQFSEEFVTFDNKIVRNLKEYSDWLFTKVMETVVYYDTYYWNTDSCMIQFADDSCESRYNIEGTDRQMNWAYAYLYLALKFQGSEQGVFYLNKYEQIVCLYRTVLKEKKFQFKTPYYLWPESGWATYQNGKYEDISHAGATIDLAQFSYENREFIQQYSQKQCDQLTYFTAEDLWKFANTFIYNIYDSPLKYHNSIDGSCYFWRYPKDCEEFDYLLGYGVSRWLSLSKNTIHPQLSDAQFFYYSISDYYTSYLYRPFKFYDGSLGSNLLGISIADKYKKQMYPMAMNPLDSMNIKIPPISPIHGVLNQLENNEFSILFFKEGIYAKEYKFKVIPNTKYQNGKFQTIDFSNIGFQIKNIPLSSQENKWIEEHCPKTKSRFTTSSFVAKLDQDSLLKYIKTIENKISIYDIYDSLKYEFEFGKGDYIYCVGDLNNDSNDEIVVYNKNSGAFTFLIWNNTTKSLMSINNCRFPQNQFIEYISTIKMDQHTYLIVYRGSDRTILLYDIDF